MTLTVVIIRFDDECGAKSQVVHETWAGQVAYVRGVEVEVEVEVEVAVGVHVDENINTHYYYKKRKEKKKRYIKIESYWISAVVSTVLSSSIIVTINIDRSFKVTSYSNNTSPLPSNDTICVIINYCLQKRTSNTSMRLFKQVTSDFVMQDISFMM